MEDDAILSDKEETSTGSYTVHRFEENSDEEVSGDHTIRYREGEDSDSDSRKSFAFQEISYAHSAQKSDIPLTPGAFKKRIYKDLDMSILRRNSSNLSPLSQSSWESPGEKSFDPKAVPRNQNRPEASMLVHRDEDSLGDPSPFSSAIRPVRPEESLTQPLVPTRNYGSAARSSWKANIPKSENLPGLFEDIPKFHTTSSRRRRLPQVSAEKASPPCDSDFDDAGEDNLLDIDRLPPIPEEPLSQCSQNTPPNLSQDSSSRRRLQYDDMSSARSEATGPRVSVRKKSILDSITPVKYKDPARSSRIRTSKKIIKLSDLSPQKTYLKTRNPLRTPPTSPGAPSPVFDADFGARKKSHDSILSKKNNQQKLSKSTESALSRSPLAKSPMDCLLPSTSPKKRGSLNSPLGSLMPSNSPDRRGDSFMNSRSPTKRGDSFMNSKSPFKRGTSEKSRDSITSKNNNQQKLTRSNESTSNRRKSSSMDSVLRSTNPIKRSKRSVSEKSQDSFLSNESEDKNFTKIESASSKMSVTPPTARSKKKSSSPLASRSRSRSRSISPVRSYSSQKKPPSRSGSRLKLSYSPKAAVEHVDHAMSDPEPEKSPEDGHKSPLKDENHKKSDDGRIYLSLSRSRSLSKGSKSKASGSPFHSLLSSRKARDNNSGTSRSPSLSNSIDTEHGRGKLIKQSWTEIEVQFEWGTAHLPRGHESQAGNLSREKARFCEETIRASTRKIYLFGDNEYDSERFKCTDREHFGGMAKVCGPFDRSSAYGIITTFYLEERPNLTDYAELLDDHFSKIRKFLEQGMDVIIPAPNEEDLTGKNKHKYFKNGKQVIHHNLGTGIANLPRDYLLMIEDRLQDLEKNAKTIRFQKPEIRVEPKKGKTIPSSIATLLEKQKASSSKKALKRTPSFSASPFAEKTPSLPPSPKQTRTPASLSASPKQTTPASLPDSPKQSPRNHNSLLKSPSPPKRISRSPESLPVDDFEMEHARKEPPLGGRASFSRKRKRSPSDSLRSINVTRSPSPQRAPARKPKKKRKRKSPPIYDNKIKKVDYEKMIVQRKTVRGTRTVRRKGKPISTFGETVTWDEEKNDWVKHRDDRQKSVRVTFGEGKVKLTRNFRVPFSILDDVNRYIDMQFQDALTDDEMESRREFIDSKMKKHRWCKFESLKDLKQWFAAVQEKQIQKEKEKGTGAKRKPKRIKRKRKPKSNLILSFVEPCDPEHKEQPWTQRMGNLEWHDCGTGADVGWFLQSRQLHFGRIRIQCEEKYDDANETELILRVISCQRAKLMLKPGNHPKQILEEDGCYALPAGIRYVIENKSKYRLAELDIISMNPDEGYEEYPTVRGFELVDENALQNSEQEDVSEPKSKRRKKKNSS